ncbi:hypothetical protein INT45_006536 [Circinella minor]|uniref:F-box domain-containing protein n=1 Tax=Circinella minor TaxID=1195481 RepID=A0A8H7RTL7_9FUNG|nr:hypothetical protein INT45_006536 [Circinella minor]
MESTKVRAGTGVQIKRKYENELEDAWDMITSSPKDPTGYLIAGYCYKDKGKQEKAINVFNMGLNQVSITHKEYEALRQGKQEAESRKNKRMDILGQLPLDIIYLIFDDYFDQGSIIPYLHVCSRWHKIIVDYSKFWERMSFGNCSSKSEMVLPYYMLLPSICQHVQELEVFNKSHIATLFELFRINNFSRIRSLKVEQNEYWAFKNPVSYAALSTALNAISKTLTTLDLSLEAKSANLPSLSDILNISSNLTTLRYVIEHNHAVLLPITITPQHKTMLKELALSSLCEEDTINSTELQKLLHHSPYLSHLAIGNCDDTIYTAIQNHGQTINSLYLDHYKLYNEFSIRHMWNNSHSIVLDNSSPGLKNFSIRNIISPWSLLSFIKYHRHTLSFLLFDLECATSDHDDDWEKCIDVLSLFPLTKLIHLKLQGLKKDELLAFEDILPAILTTMNNINNDSRQQISKLQKLELSIEAMIPNNVLNAITKMPELTELNLTRCSFDTDNMHALLKIFERRSNNNSILTARTIHTLSLSLSLLSTLHFEDVRGLNDDILLTISKIKSLTRLTINFYEHEDYTIYKTFAQNISKLPLLEWLGLRYIGIKRDHLKILATSKSLRYIDIYCIADDFNQEELCQIGKASPNNLVIREIFL